MEKMTLGCYQGFVKRSSLSWVGLVHNKEPPVGNIPSAALTQHDYDISKLSALFNTIMTVWVGWEEKTRALEIHIPSALFNTTRL